MAESKTGANSTSRHELLQERGPRAAVAVDALASNDGPFETPWQTTVPLQEQIATQDVPATRSVIPRRGSARGKRQKQLRVEVLTLGPAELNRYQVVADAFEQGRAFVTRFGVPNEVPLSGIPSGAMGESNEALQPLFGRVRAASNYGEALHWLREIASASLRHALSGRRIKIKPRELAKPERYVEVLRHSGLDVLLIEGWLCGRITHKAVNAHVDRLQAALRSRSLSAEEIKLGILAFDGAAQRLAAVGSLRGLFVYPTDRNHARDSLVTFARALHR